MIIFIQSVSWRGKKSIDGSFPSSCMVPCYRDEEFINCIENKCSKLVFRKAEFAQDDDVRRNYLSA